MPRVVYIFILALVTCCRVVSLASPFEQHSPGVLMAWHDQECNNEEGELEKGKQELNEESWLAQIDLSNLRPEVLLFNIFSDNKLLEHTRKPVTPPPDMA